MPLFSKIPVKAASIPGVPLFTGLMCGHRDCRALFLTASDSENHAIADHAGKLTCVSCGVHEGLLPSGETCLYRVLDEDDEIEEKGKSPAPSTNAGVGASGGDGSQSQVPVVYVGSDSVESDEPSTQSSEYPQAPPWTQLPRPASPACETTPQSTQLTSSSPKSTCSQPNLTLSGSGEPTKSTSESSPLCSSGVCQGNSDDHQLCRILVMAQVVVNRCRICWLSGKQESLRVHTSYNCNTGKISAGNLEWKTFKSGLKFPPGRLCYYCLAPNGAPFNHKRAPPGRGMRPPTTLCDYPDVLKELVYLLYHDQSLRKKVFAKLGVRPPATLDVYKRYVTGGKHGEMLGVYKVVVAYLDVRESEGLSVM